MEKTAGEIVKKVKAKENEFSDRSTRMDDDFDMWDLVENVYDDTVRVKTKGHTTDIEVTSNKPRTFCDSVQSILSSAEMQIAVRMVESEGEDKRADIGKLERLFHFAFEKADERLIRLLFPPLKESLIWYSLVRGWVSGRFLVYKNGSNVIFDFTALDPRWQTYEVGGEGLLWSGYKTFRTGDSLEDEYPSFANAKAKNNEVIDYWKKEKDKIINAVVCGSVWLKEPEEYDMNRIPILIMPVPTRPPVIGALGLSQEKGYGESIFAPLRRINGMRNRFATIIATHAALMAKQALINYKDEKGVELKTTANVPGGVLNLPMGHNKIEPSPMPEISPTVLGFLEWLNSQVEEATLPNIRLGSPPQSGTLQNLLQESGNRIFNPHLRNLSYFYADACRLIEEQLLTNKIKVNVQTEEKRKYYETQVSPVDLKKPHIIKVEFTARTPWTQLDTYQIADMAKRLGLPDSFIQEYILKIPDPKGLGDLSAIEMAEHSPKLAMLRAIQALANAGRQDEANQLIKDMYNMEMAEQTGQMGTTTPQEATPVNPPPELGGGI